MPAASPMSESLLHVVSVLSSRMPEGDDDDCDERIKMAELHAGHDAGQRSIL